MTLKRFFNFKYYIKTLSNKLQRLRDFRIYFKLILIFHYFSNLEREKQDEDGQMHCL